AFRPLEVGERASAILRFYTVAATEEPEFCFLWLRLQRSVDDRKAAFHVPRSLVGDGTADEQLRPFWQPVLERAHQELIRAIEIVPSRVEQIAQVPQCRCKIRIERERVLERCNRGVGLALLLENDAFVVVRSRRSRFASRRARRRSALADIS